MIRTFLLCCFVAAAVICAGTIPAVGQPSPVVDPTKNVLDLVAAQEKLRDALREADNKYQDAMREAETRRLDQMRQQEERHASVVEKMRSDKIDTSAKLLADQLREIKADIQVELRSLNQFRWETGGRSAGGNLLLYGIVQVVVTLAGIATIGGFLFVVMKKQSNNTKETSA